MLVINYLCFILNIKDKYYPASDLGVIYDDKNIVQDLLIYYSGENTDKDVNQYLEKLPKYDKVCFVNGSSSTNNKLYFFIFNLYLEFQL